METNFQNPREVFVQNGLKKKTSPIFYTGARSRENRSHLSAPFFSFLFFPVSVLILRELFRRDGDEFGKPKEVFVQNMLIYNNLLHIFTQVSPLRRNKCLS
jgi:hypothetical protein